MDDNKSSPDETTVPNLPAVKLEKKNSPPPARSIVVQRIVWLSVAIVLLMILSIAAAVLLNFTALSHPQVFQSNPTAQASVFADQPTVVVTATATHAATPTPTSTLPRPTARPAASPTATPVPDDPYGYEYFLGSNSHVYGRGQSGRLYDLGGGMASAPLTTIYHGLLFVFSKGTDNALRYKVWDGGTWGGWNWLGGTIQENSISIIQFNGRLHVFMLSGADGWIWEVVYDGTSWNPLPAGQWKPLGGTFAGGPVANITGDNLTVTAYGSNGHTYRATSSDGVSWSNFVDQGA